MSNRGMEAASRTGSRKNLVKAYRLKGEIATARREWTEAEHYLGSALQIARSIGNPTQLWKTHVSFARLYEASGRREHAFKAYFSARAVVDKVHASLRKEDLRATFERAAFVQMIRSVA